MTLTQAIEQRLEAAVNLSLKGQYEEAIAIYENILETQPDHLGTSLALAYALLQSKQIDASELIYKKILTQFPSNTIANSQLDKIRLLKKSSLEDAGDIGANIANFEFVQVPGKTRLTSLTTLGQLNVLLALQIGQKVDLILKKRHVEIRTLKGDYIGILTDDLSRKLYQLIESGNIYEAFVKFASKNEVEVFIREIFQSEANHGVISFTRSVIEHRMLALENENDESSESTKEKSDDDKTDDEDADEQLDDDEDDTDDEPELLDTLAEKLTQDEAELTSFADGDDFVGNDE